MHPDSGRADRAPELPFNAYDGDDPYIFVAYAHKDKALVYPEIGRLHELGYRIWYDEGVVPTSDWPDNVAEALDGCALFMVFMSPQAVASRNVCNEIHYAVEGGKPLLGVYLESTKLTRGLQLQLGRIQAIHKYSETEEHYRTLVERALGKYDVREEPDPSTVLRAGRIVEPMGGDPWTRPGTQLGQEIIGPHSAPMVWVPPGTFTMGSSHSNIQ